MIHDNEGINSQGNLNDLSQDVNNQNATTENKPIENDLGNTTFTQEEIEAANKPQPNVILNDKENVMAQNYRDRDRVSSRANEVTDRNDTNTGAMISGAAKGANQS